MANMPKDLTVDVKFNDAALNQLRELVERCERAAERTEAAASLRLPVKPGACAACNAKDRALADARDDRDKLAAALEAERAKPNDELERARERIAKLERYLDARNVYLKNRYREVAQLRELLEKNGINAPHITAVTAEPIVTHDGEKRRTVRRRFLAGDVVLLRERGKRDLLKYDEIDGCDVLYFRGNRNGGIAVRISEIELEQPVRSRAERNMALAEHFHFWIIDAAPGAHDEAPESVKLAAEQIGRDPWNTSYGVVEVADAVANAERAQ